MSNIESFSGTAHLLADPTRARMLAALLDGRALPAGELAHAAGITAQTASAHLAKLVAGGLLEVETQGRHRYFRLAGAHVAQALEYLAAIRPSPTARRRALSPSARELRFCRRCYDHLAGQVGVAIARRFAELAWLHPVPEKRLALSPAGSSWFAALGVDVGTATGRQCLDWTERTHHIAGPLGRVLLQALCAAQWLRPVGASRRIEVTPLGWRELREQLQLDRERILAEKE